MTEIIQTVEDAFREVSKSEESFYQQVRTITSGILASIAESLASAKDNK